MSIITAFAVPHPPLVVPGVAQGRESGLAETARALREVGDRLARLAPDAIVICTPHGTSYFDYLHLSPHLGAQGDLSGFGDPADRLEVTYDTELVAAIARAATAAGIHAGTAGEKVRDLDHGTLVPLLFARAAGVACPIVRVGVSGMTPLDHYRFGQCVSRASDELGRRVAFIASGDLSHRLRQDSPYGFRAEGLDFDSQVCQALSSGDYGSLLRLNPDVASAAMQCALPGLDMMAGALDQCSVASGLLSYETSFGVGYAVAAAIPLGRSNRRAFGDDYEHELFTSHQRRLREEDAFVRLARTSLETWVRLGVSPRIPDYLPDDLLHSQASAFVTIRRAGALRGCIGTIEPTRASLAEEIVNNAINAGTRDPRFPAVKQDELSQLSYQVDVLSEPVPIAGPQDLDPARFGVIVSAPDGRRGTLLPNLPGVTSAQQQFSIACRKAEIDPGEELILRRFEVTRHE